MDNYKPTGVVVDTQYGRAAQGQARGAQPPQTPGAASKAAKEVMVSLKNIHKTYLLGIEGVPALRQVLSEACYLVRR